MSIDFFILPNGFDINGITIYRFHDVIRNPSSSLHDVLVWNSYGMHDGRCVMSKIMESKMPQSRSGQSSFKAVA